MKTKTNLVKIDDGTYKILKKIKEKEGVPMTQFIKRAVEKYAHEKGVK